MCRIMRPEAGREHALLAAFSIRVHPCDPWHKRLRRQQRFSYQPFRNLKKVRTAMNQSRRPIFFPSARDRG